MSKPEAAWVKDIASEVNGLVRQESGLTRFRKMMGQWQARHQEQMEHKRQWTKRREQHFKRLAELPEDDPHQTDSTTPPEPGLVWEPEFCVPSGGKLLSIEGWVPPDLGLSREPEIEAILPLGERALRLDEKYTLLAAVHDCLLKGTERITPWPWPDSYRKAIPYAALLSRVPDGIEDAQHELRGFLEDVKEDLRKCGLLPPKEAGGAKPPKAPERINPTLQKAAAFIRRHSGSNAAQIAEHCGVEPDTIRNLAGKLKEMGFTSKRGCTGGYYPPAAK